MPQTCRRILLMLSQVVRSAAVFALPAPGKSSTSKER